MKKKLFLIALAIIPLTSCSISFTNNPQGDVFTSSSMPSSSSEVEYGQSVDVPTDLNSYTIVFNSNHTITQPNFPTGEAIFGAIKVKDSGNIVESVTSFENVCYGPSCLVVKKLGISITKTFSFSYVTINATPFYAKSFDHLNGEYRFVISSGALRLNNSSYIALDETHTSNSMNETKCSFQTNSLNLLIEALDERVFINSITFHY